MPRDAPRGAPGVRGGTSRRLCVYAGRLAADPAIRRILALDGERVSLGWPRAGDAVGVWGASPRAWRGERVAARTGAPLVRIEDAWLRSLFPARAGGGPPLGLLVDRTGVHFDAGSPSDLETLLATHPLDDTALLTRARHAIARIRRSHLTKYSAVDPEAAAPEPGYVLVVDQVRGDASVAASGADTARFREMLAAAQMEHPGARILVKTHPETSAGERPGHFKRSDAKGRVALCDGTLSPWVLLDGAVAVYTVSSQIGFEAILAGHRPRVFGTPFYAGWGLTGDEATFPRRLRRLTRAQLFSAAAILYPVWYDPWNDRRGGIEEVIATLEAEARAWREDRAGWVARGMRLWKRRPLQRFFGRHVPLRFEAEPAGAEERARATGARVMVWAGAARDDEAPGTWRIEDGFLRSLGLGADLVPPASLVADDLGIYYDPRRPSRLERLIADAADLPPDAEARARRLVRFLVANAVSKYNLTGPVPRLPPGHRILVPGQVEDDASILVGSPEMTTNAALLARTRAENPRAVIVWKPHPDVAAGLRAGAVETPELWADAVLSGGDIADVLNQVDEVWTMTSLTGFEALLRGCRVVTFGVPFYAGWGLTRDLGPVPARRLGGPRPSLQGLVHAALVDYPRYVDPLSGRPCPPEVAAARLAEGRIAHPGWSNRTLAKLQGLLASHGHLWR